MQTRRKLLTPFLTGDRPAEDAVPAVRPASAASGVVVAAGHARTPTPVTPSSPSATRMTAGAVHARSL